MTDEDGKLCCREKEAELESWLDDKVSDAVNKKFADKDRVMKARWVLTWKSTNKAKGRLSVLEFHSVWLLTLETWCHETSRRHSCQEMKSTVTSSSYLPMMFETF